MSLEKVVLEHLPESCTVYIAFYRDVQNAAFLHSQLLARNGEFEYGLIDASVVWFPVIFPSVHALGYM